MRENMGKVMQSTRQGVKRVADIVQNLRGFARLDRAEVDQADVNEAISDGVSKCFAGGWIDMGSLSRSTQGELPLVAGSPAQLNQVFLNLLVNAMQAIEATHRGDGRITITTEEKAGEIVVEIGDNGCGIPEEHVPRHFHAVLHDQGRGRRHRARSEHHAWHRPGSRRPSPGREHRRTRNVLSRDLADRPRS